MRISFVCALVAISWSMASDPGPRVAGARELRAEYAQRPLSFEANQGQADPRVKFLSRGSGYTLFLTPAEIVLALRSSQDRERAAPAVVRMKHVGADPASPMAGEDPLPGEVNYLIGADASKWRTHVPTYARVAAQEVYPGVDLVLYGNQRQLEFDFVVAPGADPGVIRLGFEGAERPEIDARGDLILRSASGRLQLRKPFVYQEVDGVKREIAGGFVLRGENQVGFKVGAHDPRAPLVIDPVLAYSTYLGGSGVDRGQGIAVDAAGSIYVTGSTDSVDFPIASAAQPASIGGWDAFVTKLSPGGDALVYSTYLGGSDLDVGQDIAVDPSGNACVTGDTDSRDFPIANAVQPVSRISGGFPRSSDAFVAKLDATGAALVYSTYLGGGDTDVGRGIAVDPSGNAYVAGWTTSTDFPTMNAFQPASLDTFAAGDGFVTKLDPAGSRLVYSTYLGGSRHDHALDVAVDSLGQAYVTGDTDSPDFPLRNPFKPALAFSDGADAFVAKLDPAGGALVYSTYLGGDSWDGGVGIDIDGSGNAYVAGHTNSNNFPLKNPVQSTTDSDTQLDMFVSKLSPAGSALIYSTYFGGSGYDSVARIAVDSSGSASITGSTISPDFPLQEPLMAGSGSVNQLDAFVTKFAPSGNPLAFSTYLAGSLQDEGRAVAVGPSGDLLVTGYTWSSDFPTVNAFQPTRGGGASSGDTDSFVVRISGTGTPAPAPAPAGGRVEEDDPAVSTSGVWFANGAAGHSGGRAILATDEGARAVFTFSGTGIRWIGYRDEWSGIARVYLDGVPQASVDAFAAPAQFQAVLFSAGGLIQDFHTLVIEVAGDRNPASGGSWIWIDAFEIDGAEEPPPPPPGGGRVEEDDAAVRYGGTWYGNHFWEHSGGSATLSTDAGSMAELSFTGTGASWIAYRDEWSGIARVYVDGTLHSQVDTYASPWQARTAAFTIAGLQTGPHTLTIEVTGERNPSSGGAWIWVDAFDVLP